MQKRVSGRSKKALPACRKKPFWFYHFILVLAGCLFFYQISFAQNADIDFVRSVNPSGKKSIVFRGLSASVYPVNFAVPIATFIHGEIKKDKKSRLNAYDELGSVVIAGVITYGLKTIINEERPYEKYSGVYPYEYEKGKSFPSAHAALSFATATSLSIEYKKWYVVVPAYAWAAGCSFSRIYLGEHYPSDVLAGAAIGTGSAFVSHWLTKKIFR